MPTQKQIADHLDLDQSAVSRMLDKLGIDWKSVSLDTIRVAYIRHIRGQASGHQSDGGLDLVHERVLTERIDRELKALTLEEKRGNLVNVTQLEPELLNMVGAFKAELMSRDDKLKTDLDALYGIDVDVAILNEHTFSALNQLSRYDAGGAGSAAPDGQNADAAGEAHDN